MWNALIPRLFSETVVDYVTSSFPSSVFQEDFQQPTIVCICSTSWTGRWLSAFLVCDRHFLQTTFQPKYIAPSQERFE
ncbi:hypothetical protein J6590_038157 [Homalodisca vitripennis]|nr:hypothetical protein J6590_038157 [Homalodisca vitripennis]